MSQASEAVHDKSATSASANSASKRGITVLESEPSRLPVVLATASFWIDVEEFWTDEEPVQKFNVSNVPIFGDESARANALADALDDFLLVRSKYMLEHADSEECLEKEESVDGNEAKIERTRKILTSHSNPSMAVEQAIEFLPDRVRLSEASRVDLAVVEAVAAEMECLGCDSFPSTLYDVTAAGFGYAIQPLDPEPTTPSQFVVFCTAGAMTSSCSLTSLGAFAERDAALSAMADDIEAWIGKHARLQDVEAARSELDLYTGDYESTSVEDPLDLLVFEDGKPTRIAQGCRSDEQQLHLAAKLFASNLDLDEGVIVEYRIVEFSSDLVVAPGRAVKAARKQ